MTTCVTCKHFNFHNTVAKDGDRAEFVCLETGLIERPRSVEPLLDVLLRARTCIHYAEALLPAVAGGVR